jgi:hypothetical protein
MNWGVLNPGLKVMMMMISIYYHISSYIIIYHLVIISYHYLSFISPRSGNIFFGATPAFGASLSACHAALSALCFRRGEL